MNNENLIPDEIMSLVNDKKFTELSVEEKTMVEACVTPHEYDALYEAAQMTRQYFEENIQPSAQLKKRLDEAFKQQHRNKRSILLSTVELWKVAAVFLLLLGTSLWYFNNSFSVKQPDHLLVHDTVFVEKKNDIIQHIIDTVIEYKYVAGSSSKEKRREQVKSIVAGNNHGHDTANIKPVNAENIGIRTLQAEDLSKGLPNNNGKTMQEDELVKRFSFAKI